MKPTNTRAMALKRAFDIVVALLGLALCAPLWPFFAVAIKLDSPGPVFWRQIRLGRGGRPFHILKFRTMRVAPEGSGPNFTAAGDVRITHVGSWLRRAKFDELPQLVNVLLGDMSMVGPRPETPDLISFYTPEQRAAMLSIRPGVTDYASIALRNEGELLAAAGDPTLYYRETLMPFKFELFQRYQRAISLWTDIKIILMTLAALLPRRLLLLRSENASGGASVTHSELFTK